MLALTTVVMMMQSAGNFLPSETQVSPPAPPLSSSLSPLILPLCCCCKSKWPKWVNSSIPRISNLNANPSTCHASHLKLPLLLFHMLDCIWLERQCDDHGHEKLIRKYDLFRCQPLEGGEEVSLELLQVDFPLTGCIWSHLGFSESHAVV